MKFLTICFLVAAVLPMLVSAKSTKHHHELGGTGTYNRNGKFECKSDDNCRQLYGVQQKWICNEHRMCEEADKDDDDSDERVVCTVERCTAMGEPGYTYTCNKNGDCIQVDFTTNDKRTHHQKKKHSTRLFKE